MSKACSKSLHDVKLFSMGWDRCGILLKQGTASLSEGTIPWCVCIYKIYTYIRICKNIKHSSNIVGKYKPTHHMLYKYTYELTNIII